MTGAARVPSTHPESVLCVDLDGTLLRTDTLYECVLDVLRKRRRPFASGSFPLPAGLAVVVGFAI